MAKRSKRLQLLKDLAEQKKKQADQFLAASRNRVAQDQKGLEQLQAFLFEYQNEFVEAGQKTMSPCDMQTRQAFLNKITTTIERHQQAMRQNQQELKTVQEHWSASYAKLKAMETLQNKAIEQENAEYERQLQKELDERSQMKHPNFI